MTGLPVQIGRSSHGLSAVLFAFIRKQPRDPRSVGCSGRMRTQTTERSTKRRLFRPDAEANNREIHEVSVVPDDRGCKQPTQLMNNGCSGMKSVSADGFFRNVQLWVGFGDNSQYHYRERSRPGSAGASQRAGVGPCARAFRRVGSPEIVAGDRVPEIAADSPDDSAYKDIPQKHFFILFRNRMLHSRRDKTR